jgi:hypothetical protein
MDFIFQKTSDISFPSKNNNVNINYHIADVWIFVPAMLKIFMLCLTVKCIFIEMLITYTIPGTNTSRPYSFRNQ